MLLLGVILVLAIPDLSYSFKIESEIHSQKVIATKENEESLGMNSCILLCEKELAGDYDMLSTLLYLQYNLNNI